MAKKRSVPRKKVLSKLKKANIQGPFVLTQPALVRIFHWGFALCITGIILTGFELHKPLNFLAINFGKLFILHMTFAWLALGFAALRFTDALLRRDTSLLPKPADFKNFIKLMSYYLFFRESPPPTEKYNSGQKLMYFSWTVLFLVASFLGLASYWMNEHLIWVWRLVGGWQVVRWIKFSAAIYFSATIPVHIYLSVTEDLSRLQAMVTGYERRE